VYTLYNRSSKLLQTKASTLISFIQIDDFVNNARVEMILQGMLFNIVFTGDE
jgi:hypothetical protein